MHKDLRDSFTRKKPVTNRQYYFWLLPKKKRREPIVNTQHSHELPWKFYLELDVYRVLESPLSALTYRTVSVLSDALFLLMKV
jgi:hypothetical protein